MLEHRELEVDEDGTPHPEQPARILAIYRAIKGTAAVVSPLYQTDAQTQIRATSSECS
jgi:hypothetical protein